MNCGKNSAVLSHCVEGYTGGTGSKEFFSFCQFWAWLCCIYGFSVGFGRNERVMGVRSRHHGAYYSEEMPASIVGVG
jgi:hypothetical protein